MVGCVCSPAPTAHGPSVRLSLAVLWGGRPSPHCTHTVLGLVGILFLLICFRPDLDLFHTWFGNFQTQRAKNWGGLEVPALNPLWLRVGSSVYHVPPPWGQVPLTSHWGQAVPRNAAGVCDKVEATQASRAGLLG